MKIVILSDRFDNSGGAAVVAKSLAFGLKNFGHDISVITTVQDKSKIGKEIRNGVDIYSIYSKYNLFWRSYLSLYNPQTVKEIKKILSNIKPDVVHAHNIHIYLSYYSLKLAKKIGAKVFLTAHDAMLFHYGKLTEFIDKNNLNCPQKFNYKITVWQRIKKAGKTYNPFRNIVIRHYLKYVDKIFSVSHALKQALNDNGINNVAVVFNGIDVNGWRVSSDEIKEFKKHYNLETKNIILFGGRLNEAKGGREIILAVKEVIKKEPNTVLAIAGNHGDYLNKMLSFAKEIGVADNVVFVGWLSNQDLKVAFNAANIVTMPSICFDTFGMVSAEAMVCKKPVVATCFGGSREVVVDGETGYIVNPYNTKFMAEKIIDLLRNPEKSKVFGEAGNNRIKNEFSLEKMTENYMSWYKSC